MPQGLPIGFFMPLPLPAMAPFMWFQSAMTGEGFGYAYQGAKRKISSMSNEEFNKLSAVDIAKMSRDDMQGFISVLPDMFAQARQVNKMILTEMVNLLGDTLNFGLQTFLEGGTQFFNRATTGDPNKSFELLPNAYGDDSHNFTQGPTIPPATSLTGDNLIHNLGSGSYISDEQLQNKTLEELLKKQNEPFYNKNPNFTKILKQKRLQAESSVFDNTPKTFQINKTDAEKEYTSYLQDVGQSIHKYLLAKKTLDEHENAPPTHRNIAQIKRSIPVLRNNVANLKKSYYNKITLYRNSRNHLIRADANRRSKRTI